MKLNLANPATGAMKVLDVDDEKILQNFYDKRMAQEIDGEILGSEFAGYLFKIAGGNDKQGFPMMQGVLTATRVRILMKKGFCYYRPRRSGERKRKSVRGCIVGPDLSVLNLVVVKKGLADVPGLTDEESAQPARLGPKRANNIRNLFNLSKEDNVKEYVMAREAKGKKSGKVTTKRPKIQRLVTKTVLSRKRLRIAAKQAQRQKSLAEAKQYEALRQKRIAERKERRSSRKSSRKD